MMAFYFDYPKELQDKADEAEAINVAAHNKELTQRRIEEVRKKYRFDGPRDVLPLEDEGPPMVPDEVYDVDIDYDRYSDYLDY